MLIGGSPPDYGLRLMPDNETESQLRLFDLGLTAIALGVDDVGALRRSMALFETALSSDHWMLRNERLALEWREQLMRAHCTVLCRIEQIRKAEQTQL